VVGRAVKHAITPTQLVEAHIDLTDRMRTRDFRGYTWDLGRGTIGRAHEMPHQIYEGMLTGTMAANLYRVTGDMSSLIQQSTTKLDESDRFDRRLAPSGCGLAFFEEPITVLRSNGAGEKIHWLLWAWLKGGVLVMPFMDLNRYSDEHTESFLETIGDVRNILGRWACRGVELMEQGQALGGEYLEVTPAQALAALNDGRGLSPSDNPMRLIHALWLMLRQEETETETEHVRRAARQAAERSGLPGRITVVQWKRGTQARARGESKIDWQYRTQVSGHWKWVRYGPGRQFRRWQQIAPYTKGPADKPIRHSEKIYDVRVPEATPTARPMDLPD
jgi:hypothetical protein